MREQVKIGGIWYYLLQTMRFIVVFGDKNGYYQQTVYKKSVQGWRIM